MALGLRVCRLAFGVGYQDFIGTWGWKAWLGGWMFGVLAQVAFVALLGRLVRSDEVYSYLLVGNALVVGCFQANLAVSASTWDRADGTYPLLVIAPSSLVLPMLGRTSAWLMAGTATSTLAFVLAWSIFGLWVPWPGAMALAPLSALACGGSYAMATCIGALVAWLPASRNIVHRLQTTCIMAFCGVNVPLSYWPSWLQALASVLPVTHGLRAIRRLLSGERWEAVLSQAGLELLVAVAWLAAAALLLDRLAEAGRASGSIDFV